jgi:tRNA(His) guanylyltransferase
MSDFFGDRMKEYEKMMQSRCLPLLPICARIDGKCFHTYCRGFEKPFDMGLIGAMREATRRLVEETGAKIGYTQSDEITLIYYSDDYKSQLFFNGKVQKMVSILASMATVYFNEEIQRVKPGIGPALFDCRVWQVPNLEEAANVLLWREQDAVRNSISMLGRAHFSHKQLHKKSSKKIVQMLEEDKNVFWAELPDQCKRGSYFRKESIERRFTPEEIALLPEEHAARKNPDLIVKRSDVREMEYFSMQSTANKVGVLFKGEFQEIITQKLPG